MNGPRLALYFAPEPGSMLQRLGAAILGRDAESGEYVRQPVVPGLEPARFAELTASPRRYGLHATLKAPFRLAAGRGEPELLDAVCGFARRSRSFTIGGLRLERLGTFLALVSDGFHPEIGALADACVMEFDVFRAPPRPEELERRRVAGLSPGQEAMLQRWGYPYAMDEFRFHISLTGTIQDAAEMRLVETGLRILIEDVCRRPVEVKSLCVFRQDSPAAPFHLLARLPLGL